MSWTQLPLLRGGRLLGWQAVCWLLLSYVLLYPLGYLSKPVAAPAAIWPAHALTFAMFALLPIRLWPIIAFGTISTELACLPFLNWMRGQPQNLWTTTLGFAIANSLTTAGAAGLCRLFRLFREQDRLQLSISPLWILALFVGVMPGALLGTEMRVHQSGTALEPANVGLWVVAAVLTIVTFGPAVFGFLVGFSKPVSGRARTWEGGMVSCIVLALIIWFALAPWPATDRLLDPILFAVPLVWLALRFSGKATSIGVAIVASGVLVLASHGAGAHVDVANVGHWRDIVISIDIFLLLGCGGALLINLMTLKQLALLEELAGKHAQLQKYAQALALAEETARRAIAADLHDGIGQVLAGQSMTIAALRAHATQPLSTALLEEIAAASREAQAGVRTMIQDLSPPELLHASLEETLRWLAELFKTRFEFTVIWRVHGTADLHGGDLQLVYRCIRELLMNACKHSQQQSAEVEVDLSSTSIDITVIDEGIGFDTLREDLPGHRFGLAQLRERVRAAGGDLVIDATVGEGCRATVHLSSSSPPMECSTLRIGAGAVV